jgi:uncharacterized protein Yka (UPF0111/DUF47 family)
MHLLPRDEKFFDLLVEHARIVLDASSLVANGSRSGPGQSDAHAMAEKVRELELKGDDALREINRRLHKSFITPIDPEDIHQLAALIDEVLDHLDAAAYRIEAFGIDGSSERVAEVARMVHGCAEAMFEAMESLQRDGVKNPDELTKRCEAINRRELELENRVRELVRDLFANEKDPIALMKQKDIYELLESAGDCCEYVADVLEAIAVKNS